jgi:ketosteroid isomerase-like protein
MRHWVLSFVCIFTLLAIGNLGLRAMKSSAAEAELRSADQQWLKVFSAKDLDRSVAFVAPNGSLLSPNAPIATGAEAIRKSFAGFFALPDLQISWTPTTADASRSNDLGYTQGTYEMSFRDPGGKQVSDKGKYVTVWKRQPDKSWKVVADIFNSDLPPAGTPAQQQ